MILIILQFYVIFDCCFLCDCLYHPTLIPLIEKQKQKSVLTLLRSMPPTIGLVVGARGALAQLQTVRV